MVEEEAKAKAKAWEGVGGVEVGRGRNGKRGQIFSLDKQQHSKAPLIN